MKDGDIVGKRQDNKANKGNRADPKASWAEMAQRARKTNLTASVVFMLLVCLAGGLFSCNSVDQLTSPDFGDLTPPRLVAHGMDASGVVSLDFDEPATLLVRDLDLDAGISAWTADGSDPLPEKLSGKNISFLLKGNMIPGSTHSLGLEVSDEVGNTLTMILPFWGPNPQPARLLINEIAAKSSTTIRDTLEFLVTRSGNLGGLTLCTGTPDDFDSRCLFPACQVTAGDLVLLHMKPEGTSEEINETTSRTVSGGLNSHDGAWDFWHPEAPGLGDSSGIITVCETPLGPVQDLVFYTDKVTQEGKAWRSFGTSALLARAEYATAGGFWQIQGTAITVEDGASSAGLSATRTLCRKGNGTDTDSKNDWYVGSTGSISLGIDNQAAAALAAEKAKAREAKAASRTNKPKKPRKKKS